MIFTNAYANGYKSIHGMSSVLSGIPSFKDAFTSSPYPNQTIQSLVSVLNGEGYDTSFSRSSKRIYGILRLWKYSGLQALLWQNRI